MSRFLRPVRSGIFVLATASLLASCKDEGGVLDVFFWARGDGDCDRIVVTIDMQSADALLAPPREGRDQCDIYKVLENRGCDFEVETIDDGRLLQVTIDDCEIDQRSGLFRCAFSDGELEDIDLHATAVCDCVDASCDETPRLCVSSDSEDAACETCNNGIDDDGNGDVDCEDEACSAECVTTTSSTSTSTSNSVGLSTQPTMSTTTSTTFPVVPTDEYAAVFAIDNGAGIGAVQFDIGYGAVAAAAARGARAVVGQPVCVSLVATASASFQVDDAQKVVHANMTNLPGSSGPIELVRCTFAVAGVPSSGDFDVDVVEALDLEGDPISSPPPINLADLLPVTTTTTLFEGEPTTTTTLPDPQDYDITFRVFASQDVGALQWSTRYGQATGVIQGKGNQPKCELLVPNALRAWNDKDRVCSGGGEYRVCRTDDDCTGVGTCSVLLEELTIGVVSVHGIDPPADLVRCVFNGTSNDPPVASDFQLVLEDATNPEGTPISISLAILIEPR